MGAQTVWYSRDGRLRVDLVDQRHGDVLLVFEQGVPVGEFPDVAALTAFLSERYRLGFADLVKPGQ